MDILRQMQMVCHLSLQQISTICYLFLSNAICRYLAVNRDMPVRMGGGACHNTLVLIGLVNAMFFTMAMSVGWPVNIC